ncbi:MAG TPA: hypothetical protein PK156_35240, partial [Polyangium sp.]|nr:hypothetical protein [Polyangium sp.]
MNRFSAIPFAMVLSMGLSGLSCHESIPEPNPPLVFRVNSIDGASIAYVDESTCFHVIVEGASSDAIAVWNLGDGTKVELAPNEPVCHVYGSPGHRLIGVTVISGDERRIATRSISVVPKPMVDRPTASSTILLDNDASRLWVVNPDSDSVAVLSAEPLAFIAEIPVCGHPRTVARQGRMIATTCQSDGKMVFLDADSFQITGSIDFGVGTEPFGVAASPIGNAFYVTLFGSGELAAVDGATLQTSSRIPVGPDARGVASVADGLVVLTHWRASDAGAVVTFVDARDAKAIMATGNVVMPPLKGIDSDTNNSGVASFLGQIVPSPDGRRALVPSLRANVVTGLYRTGEPLSFETTARAILTELEMAGPAPPPMTEPKRTYAFDDLDMASAAAFSPDGDVVYVAIQGAERIEVRDAFSFDVAGSIDDVGHAPQGIVLNADGRRLFVQSFLSRSVRAYDVTDLSIPPKPLADVKTTEKEPLSPEVLLGKQIFYRSRDPRMSRTSYLSCASCHLDGDSDNLTWDFTQRGEGMRNTISLVGRGGTKHGPLHWSANFDEVQDFEHDIRGPMGGRGFLPDSVFHSGTRDQTLGDPKAGLSAELDALTAYVASLESFGRSPYRKTDSVFLASRTHGRELFMSAETGCAG